MPDIEKVKTGIFEMLQRCSWDDIDKERHRFQPVLNDALELLKDKQPIRPTSYCVLDKNGRTSLRWKCGRCGRLIKYNKGVIKGKDYESIDFYCGNCGTPILWNNKNCSF